jgi:hypothetical protein
MFLRNRVCALGVVLAVTAPAAYAQYATSSSERPIQWYVTGGLNVPASDTSKLLTTGWTFGFGVIFTQPGAPLDLRLDMSYGSNNVTSHALYQAAGTTGTNIDGGWADFWSFSLGADFKHHFSDTNYGYITGGIGAYYTSISLTEIGYGYICNPWWYYCYIGTGQAVVASHASTKFGWDLGLGFGWSIGNGSSLFLEARYTWIDTSNEKLKYIPVVVGVRF